MQVPIFMASERIECVSAGVNIWRTCTHDERVLGPGFLHPSPKNCTVVTVEGTSNAARTLGWV